MKFILSFLLLLLTSSLFSQIGSAGKPDYKAIEKAIAKKKSPYYYPALLKRYEKGDSTMTIEEERHLYYGYTFQDAYDPYSRSEYEDSLQRFYEMDTLVKEDYLKLIDITSRILKENPFNLNALGIRTYAFRATDQEEDFERTRTQLRLILRVIITSGDGLEENSAFYVICVPDEYETLSALGYNFSGSQTLVGQCDYLAIAENEENVEGLYFNISPSLNYLSKLFK
jgi:hypothetical protein